MYKVFQVLKWNPRYFLLADIFPIYVKFQQVKNMVKPLQMEVSKEGVMAFER